MMEADQMLFHAVNLIEAGNKTDGREMLKRVIGEHPNNADALFVFAQYCGKRSQSITALEQVLLLEPEYPGAREALERIKLMPPTQPLPPQTSPSAFVALEIDDPWSKALQVDPAVPPVVPGKVTAPTKKERRPALSKGLIAVTASLFGVLVIVGLALAALLLAGRPPAALAGAAPSATVESLPAAPPTLPATLTLRPYRTPTATPDPCTCAAVEAYMSSHLTRVNQLLGEMALTTKKLKRNSLKETELATLVQSATQMYTTQRAESVPPCLESYQKDAVQMFWTWQQAVTAINNGDVNGALAFTEIISANSNQLDAKLAKLANYPTLQACTFAFPTLIAP